MSGTWALGRLQTVLQQFQQDQDGLLGQEVKRFKEQVANLHRYPLPVPLEGEVSVLREKTRVEGELEEVRGEMAQRASEWRGTSELRSEMSRREEALSRMEAELNARDHQLADIHAKASAIHRVACPRLHLADSRV